MRCRPEYSVEPSGPSIGVSTSISVVLLLLIRRAISGKSRDSIAGTVGGDSRRLGVGKNDVEQPLGLGLCPVVAPQPLASRVLGAAARCAHRSRSRELRKTPNL